MRVFMRTELKAAAIVAAGVLGVSCAEAQVRIGQWNITNWNSSDVTARGAAFQSAIFDVAPNGQRFQPDVLILEEITEGSGGGATAVAAFVNLMNAACGCANDWVAAPYVTNQGDTGNALLYRASKIQLLGTVTLGVSGVDVGGGATQSPRDNQRWRVRLIGYTGAGAELYIYGAHFKAGDTSADQARRNPEGLRIRNDSNVLPAGIGGFLIGADFNIQDSAQLAYQYLVGAGAGFPTGDPRLISAGQFFDPINRPGAWNNNCSFRNIHTQEPGGAGTSGGGMDDRHDQILISASLRDGQGMSYIPATPGGNILAPFISVPGGCVQNANDNYWNDPNHSYRAWGNDGNHFNTVINAGGTNSQVGSVIATNLITTTATGGHLPVYLDVQVPAKLGGPTGTINVGTFNVGQAASVTIQISNAGDVAKYSKDGSGWGIDPLTYTLTATAGFSAPGGTFNRTATAAPAQTNSHVITMDTSTPGTKTGVLTIQTDDPDNPTRNIVLSGVVNGGGPPPGNYDVNGDGVVNNDDLYAWFGLFTDVNQNGTVDANDIAALRTFLRWTEVQDMTQGRR